MQALGERRPRCSVSPWPLTSRRRRLCLPTVYAAGDVGILLYADHDIDRIAEAGQECQPNTERNHAEEDAYSLVHSVPRASP